MLSDNHIINLKQDLLKKYNISCDRDLVKQLNIKDEDKEKLYAWIRYQCAYSFRDGFEHSKIEQNINIMDKLIEEYKEQLRNDDNGGYGYPVGLKNKILKEIDSNNFEIPVNIVNDMITTAKQEGILNNNK